MLQNSICQWSLAWPTHCTVCTISWPVKQFIEQLSQYIAPGRLCPWPPPPIIPTYHRLFCAFLSSNWTCFCTTCSLIWALACSKVWRLLGLGWPCFTPCICSSILSKSCDKMSNSLFNWARERPLPCAIVFKKVTNRLTPVCQQAFWIGSYLGQGEHQIQVKSSKASFDVAKHVGQIHGNPRF